MVSVIIPCYNEEAVLPYLHTRITEASRSWDMSYEVVAVDDGSRDRTWDILRNFANEDPRWRVVRFSRNFGHQAAVSAGLFYSRGKCAVIIDADLQDPPEQISTFIAQWRNGFDVVYAVRTKRKEGFVKRVCYKSFYYLLRKIADVDIPLDSGDFCLMDRKVVDLLNAMPEQNRFVRGLRAWAGFKQTGVVYERDARAAGKPQYTLKKLIKLAFDGVFSFSTVPLRITTYLGLAVSLFAFLGAAFSLLQRVFMSSFARLGIGPVPGYATIVISIFFIGGIQLVSLGVIGEYIGRIYSEVKKRPSWVASDGCGIDLK